MGTRYPGRDKSLNRVDRRTIRVDGYQLVRIEHLSKRFNMTFSEIAREALSVWLNMNDKEAK